MGKEKKTPPSSPSLAPRSPAHAAGRQSRWTDCLPTCSTNNRGVSPGKHAGAAVTRRGRARGGSGEGGGSGDVQGHRAPSPLKLDPPRTLPDARTPTPMSFREGLGAPGTQFHVNCRGSPPSSALPAAVRPPSEDCHRAGLVNSSQLINRVFLHQSGNLPCSDSIGLIN